jgi:hypothetical protein
MQLNGGVAGNVSANGCGADESSGSESAERLTPTGALEVPDPLLRLVYSGGVLGIQLAIKPLSNNPTIFRA